MIDFILNNIGFIRFVDGGFTLSMDWGFFLGVSCTFLVLRHVVWRRKFPKRTDS